MAERFVKPSSIVDRDHEWAILGEFVGGAASRLRLAIVSGRRRHGKSFLLRGLTQGVGGLFLTAVQEEGRVPALRRFAAAIAAHAGVRPGALRLDDWQDTVRTALEVVNRAPGAPLVVIDELPYLLQHSPEVPGLLQLMYDQSQMGEVPGGRLILCGSALSVMHELLSGTKPLRGRATIDLRLAAFDYRTSRAHWSIQDCATALRVNAVLSGAPGYLPLAAEPVPQTAEEFDAWVCRALLDPGRALYSRVESEFLLREDPRITHRTVYYDLLSAIAQGASTPSKAGALLERHRSAVAAPLEVLESAGYVRKEQDMLRPRHPTIAVADPVIRFNQLITLSRLDLVENLRSEQAWQDSRPTFHSKILGPHFEDICREWTRKFAAAETSLSIGSVGSAEIPDPHARTKHEIDVIALEPGERPRAPRARIALLGEAKATIQPRGLADLTRLGHIRDLLIQQGHGAKAATLTLFSLHGFQPDLTREAARRPDVLLVDLVSLYGEHEPLGGG